MAISRVRLMMRHTLMSSLCVVLYSFIIFFHIFEPTLVDFSSLVETLKWESGALYETVFRSCSRSCKSFINVSEISLATVLLYALREGFRNRTSQKTCQQSVLSGSRGKEPGIKNV